MLFDDRWQFYNSYKFSLYLYTPRFHVIVSVVRIVSAPASDRDDHMDMYFVAILTILATETI